MSKPTIVAASLDDQQLRESIEKLVNSYKGSLESMKEATNQAVENMRNSLMSLGKVKIDMSGAFDNVESAKKKLSGAATGGSGSASASAPDTIGALKQQIEEQKKVVDQQKEYSNELQAEVNYLERLKGSLKTQLRSEQQITQEWEKRAQKAQSTKLTALGRLPDTDLKSAEFKLRELLKLKERTRQTPVLDEAKVAQLNKRIQDTINKVRELRKKPPTLKQVLGMDASSLDAIQAKMKAIANFRMNVNADAHPRVIQMLNKEYDELHKKQIRLMGQNASLVRSNRVLGSAFGYLRNRIIYAFTLGALAKFFKDVRDIRAEYEMLDRSIGILVGDFEKGTQIFNELNQMALKSPFTLIELGTAAKQLTAYNFAANEVVDTTRRLADISAALGVPMERLTYNLGQIKAQGVLNARDARDFANAGLAIVPMLAKMYTEQKTFGDELVTTAQVYDMMSKKMVTYADVLKVLQQATDEGGKFFNFQARQADTLKVQIANLSLAYNNMLNEIGKDNQGILSGSIGLVRSLFENWREVTRAILSVITTLGVYKTLSMLAVGWKSISAWLSLAKSIKSAKDAMALFNLTTKGNPLVLLISALTAAASYFVIFKNKAEEATVEVERFGESASKQMKKVDTLGKVLNGISENSTTYKNALSELNQIVTEYGLTEIKNRNEINSKIEQTIQLIKEEGKERQYANNIAKGEERYQNEIENIKSSFKDELLDLEGWFGTTDKVKKEIIDNADAITDITGSIIEENINLVVNKTGEEAYKGLIEIRKKVDKGLQSAGLSNNVARYLLTKGYVTSVIKSYQDAAEEQERHNQKITAYYKEANKATKATMAFTDKVDANARALRKNSNDALSLYNNVYSIVELAKKKHTINFDLKLTAQNPPKWMFSKSLPELQELARRFAAIAQSGGHAKGHTVESTYERALQYAAAARTKQEDEERKSRQKDTKTRTKQSDEIAKAIKGEISLVKELQSAYDTLTKKGESHANAIEKVQGLYGKTIDLLNKDMDKFGLPRLDLSIIKGNNHNEVLAFFERLRNVLESKGLGNVERMEAVEGVVKEFRLKAETYNLDMITKGLNNELGKLKDEYELAVELDANPELGGMFADMMGIDTSSLPHTFGEAFEKANEIAKEKLKELKVDTSNFNLMSSIITADKDGMWMGQRLDSEPIQKLIAKQKEWRDMFKKNLLDTEKMLDDFVKKYGDYSDKVAEIESNRINQIKRLNDAYYTEEMRRLPEYYAKLNAINQGAKREESNAAFEEFKNSRYYTMMFENLDYISTKTIRDMRDRLRELMDSMHDLTPEQLKQVITQYEKLEQKLSKRSPFRTLTKDLREYFSTIDERKAANKDFRAAQKEYDAQTKVVAELKKKYENAIAYKDENYDNLDELLDELDIQQEILDKIKEKLKLAEGTADKYNLLKKLAKSEALAVANVVGQNLQSLGELRDFLQQDLGIELSDELNGLVDGLSKVGQGINKITSSATSGDVIGVVTGVGQTIYGLYDGIASIFGGGSVSDKKITKQIQESEFAVKRLELAYIDLEQAVNRAYGASVAGAKRATLANKELQLEEIKRQIQLEKSRDSKHRDEGRIIELQKQYKELMYEIQNGTREIVDDLLGTDAGSFAEDLVQSMIDAFRRGEDYMEVFEKKFETMVDNMIMKVIVSRVVSSYIDRIWDSLDKRLTARSKNEAKDLAEIQNKRAQIEDMSDEQVARIAGHTTFGWDSQTIHQWAEEYRNMLNEEEKAAQAAYDAATEIDSNDINFVLSEIAKISPELAEKLKEAIGEWYHFGEDSQLSQLQQGIQGITENTAGALEAYMNGVSQQVYYQSDVLTQIRDTVQSFDMDIQTGTLSQILLQLQASFQTQNAIRSILEGWSSASGMAMRVELVQ